MPFDYLHSNLSTVFNEKIKTRSAEMFHREIEERARLLYRLKFPEIDAIARIKQNIEWEFDDMWTVKKPSFYAKIDEIVSKVYKSLKGKLD